MPAAPSPELGRTRRSSQDILADAHAAEVFWAGLEQLDEVRRAVLLRESALSDPLTIAVTEAAAWNRRYSTRRAQTTAGANRGLDHLAPDLDRRREYVDAQTAARMPPPRQWNRNTWVGREQERHERQLWRKRIDSPSPYLRRRLETEGEEMARAAARARPAETGALVAPEDMRRGRLARLATRSYVPGQVHPAGMSYQRAMDIAIACLDREAELIGVPRDSQARLDDAMSMPSLGR